MITRRVFEPGVGYLMAAFADLPLGWIRPAGLLRGLRAHHRASMGRGRWCGMSDDAAAQPTEK